MGGLALMLAVMYLLSLEDAQRPRDPREPPRPGRRKGDSALDLFFDEEDFQDPPPR